jgi:hypothetical protein
LFLATVCGVEEKTCLASTPRAVIPLWNGTTARGDDTCTMLNRMPYLAATYPVDAMERMVPAGTTISFMFIQSSSRLTSCNQPGVPLCSAAMRRMAQERLTAELSWRGSTPISHRIFYNQTKLFAQVSAVGGWAIHRQSERLSDRLTEQTGWEDWQTDTLMVLCSRWLGDTRQTRLHTDELAD